MNPRSRFGGVDIGGTKIEVVVTDERFQVLGQARGPSPGSEGPVALVNAVIDLLTQAQQNAKVGSLTAVGVGSPGSVDQLRGTVSPSPNMTGWPGPYPLGPAVCERLGVPVRVTNDVRAAMAGEYRLGAAAPFRDVLGVWFGTGIGGALVLEGKLRNGVHGACGEIGHTVVKPGGRRCGCGRRGCLEAYAGRASMERQAAKLVAEGGRTRLFTIMRESGRTQLTSGTFARALEKGDAMAAALIERAVETAGVGIASAVNVIDVEAVVIGGGIGSRLGEPFVKRVAEAMQPHLLTSARVPESTAMRAPGKADGVKVVLSALGDLAGALGAATEAVPSP